MPKLNDTVTVNIKGPANLSDGISIGEGASVSFTGRIIAETLTHYNLQLHIAMNGQDVLSVPKELLVAEGPTQVRVTLVLSALATRGEPAEETIAKIKKLSQELVGPAWKEYGQIISTEIEIL
jgi:hypothetical protein